MNINVCSHVKIDVLPVQLTAAVGIMHFVLYIVVSSLVSLFGLITNFINTVVYWKMGIKDSTTVMLFSLSVVDFAYSLLILTSSLSVLIEEMCPFVSVLDLVSFSSYGLNQLREKVYTLSITITVFLSLERCYCVLFPFKFRIVFTKSRSVKAIACVVFICGTLLVPDYITQGLAWRNDSRFTAFRLLLRRTEDRFSFTIFKDFLLSVVWPVVASVTVTACAIVLTARIQAWGRFRHLWLSPHKQEREVQKHEKSSISKTTLSKQDSRLCKTVFVIDAIFIACNVPKCTMFFNSVLKVYTKEISFDGSNKYQNLWKVIITLIYVFESINTAFNFLVYISSSAKFRTVCRDMFYCT